MFSRDFTVLPAHPHRPVTQKNEVGVAAAVACSSSRGAVTIKPMCCDIKGSHALFTRKD